MNDLMTWLAQIPERTLFIVVIVLTCYIVSVQLITIAILKGIKHKVTHISGFRDRKAKKGEIEK